MSVPFHWRKDSTAAIIGRLPCLQHPARVVAEVAKRTHIALAISQTERRDYAAKVVAPEDGIRGAGELQIKGRPPRPHSRARAEAVMRRPGDLGRLRLSSVSAVHGSRTSGPDADNSVVLYGRRTFATQNYKMLCQSVSRALPLVGCAISRNLRKKRWANRSPRGRSYLPAGT